MTSPHAPATPDPDEAARVLEPPARPGFSWKKLAWISWPLGVIVLLVGFGVPLCPTKNLLGIPCPGCGLTRATEAMLTGDVMGVLRYHPLAPIVTPLVLFSVFRAMLVSAGAIPLERRDLLSRLPRWFWPVLAIAMLVLWGVRFSGALGGLPDPIEPTNGMLYRAGRFLLHDLWV